jgi:predicted DNA repair protein MutK
MAIANLLALLDDIATVLDDISLMTQAAAKKTAAVMGDDLAVNAEKVIGVRPNRELPVVWAVAKGSLLNKVILVPAAVLVAGIAPWLITPALVCGGLFLCFEGAEKLLHSVHKHTEQEAEARLQPLADESVDLVALEKKKIRGAVRTDFILSLEIIVLTLAVVEASSWPTQLGVLAGISLLMTIGVYGLVAGIVKVDDLGVYLLDTADGDFQRGVGRGLVRFAPRLMQALSLLGTVAMFLVGGGILLHASHELEHLLTAPLIEFGLNSGIAPTLVGGLLGLLVGLLLAVVFAGVSAVRTRLTA